MSQPKMTSQKPKPPSSALQNLSSETYLPRRTPSTSKPPIFTRRMPCFSKASLSCFASMGREASTLSAQFSGTPSFGSSRLPMLCDRGVAPAELARLPPSQFHSMNFTIDECSIVTCETYVLLRRTGRSRSIGTRVP